MAKEEILAMEAGKELNTFVEEKLFNHRCEVRWCNWLPQGYFEVQSYGQGREAMGGGLLDENESLPCYMEGEKWVVVPFYSTDISAAWEVVEKMVKEYGDFVIDYDDSYNGGQWSASVDKLRVAALAKTAPEAICKAALLAKLMR